MKDEADKILEKAKHGVQYDKDYTGKHLPRQTSPVLKRLSQSKKPPPSKYAPIKSLDLVISIPNNSFRGYVE